MQPQLYLVASALVLAIIVVVFRVIVPRSYRHLGRLGGLASASQYIAILVWVAFGCLNLPRGWPAVRVGPVQEAVGWVLFVGGWLIVLVSLLRLGLRRSHGLEVAGLRQTGLYGLSRNPQATAFLIAMVGYVVLWPTWRNAGLVALAIVFNHLMIRAEEEHLGRVFGREYEGYCRQVPRYIGRTVRIEDDG
jgi:protein-S-isoprenylcysteine O-methyltransferase Ste14